MRSLIAAVYSVATLLSVSSSAFAQGAQPTAPPPPPIGSPSTVAIPSAGETRLWREPGRYHPCPASVSFGNGRSVCLGLERGPRTYGCGRWCRW